MSPTSKKTVTVTPHPLPPPPENLQHCYLQKSASFSYSPKACYSVIYPLKNLLQRPLSWTGGGEVVNKIVCACMCLRVCVWGGWGLEVEIEHCSTFPKGQPYVDFPSYILRNHIFKNVTFGQMCKRSSAHILSNTS